MLASLVLVGATVGCGSSSPGSANNTPEIAFVSPVLNAQKVIPARYKCDLNKIWLPVKWGALPADTRELVIYMARYSNATRSAAGVKVRLLSQALLVGLKPKAHELRTGKLPKGVLVGEYGTGTKRVPICPPGRTQQGFLFRIYALSNPLNLKQGSQEGAGLVGKLNKEALAAGTFTASYART